MVPASEVAALEHGVGSETPQQVLVVVSHCRPLSPTRLEGVYQANIASPILSGPGMSHNAASAWFKSQGEGPPDFGATANPAQSLSMQTFEAPLFPATHEYD